MNKEAYIVKEARRESYMTYNHLAKNYLFTESAEDAALFDSYVEAMDAVEDYSITNGLVDVSDMIVQKIKITYEVLEEIQPTF